MSHRPESPAVPADHTDVRSAANVAALCWVIVVHHVSGILNPAQAQS